jgi:hypothetical protein
MDGVEVVIRKNDETFIFCCSTEEEKDMLFVAAIEKATIKENGFGKLDAIWVGLLLGLLTEEQTNYLASPDSHFPIC